MVTGDGWIRTEREGDRLVLTAGGRWQISTLADIDTTLRDLTAGSARRARIDLAAVETLDSTGAWILHRTLKQLRASGLAAEFAGVGRAHGEMLELIERDDVEQTLERDEIPPVLAMVRRVGEAAYAVRDEAEDLLNFLGATVLTALRTAAKPARLRLISLASHVERVGLDALPIVGLLSFLIGIVLAYQGADQLRRFGAEIFTVDLLGVSILREMGVLLTAIVIAGRTGSAFTAEIGTMQVNEEVDAMRTIGLDPIEVLVLPRILALVIALPLLAVFADLLGLIGGALMSFVVLDISLAQFAERFRTVVPMWSFWIGLIKAPVFGLAIGLVGCRAGLGVRGSAESVGKQTTKSVVVAIFLVIVIDAIFSILFSLVGV